MSFNGSFGEEDVEINKNIIELEGNKVGRKEIKFDDPHSNNEIFDSLPMEIECNNFGANNMYTNLLTREIVIFHFSNIFNIIKKRIMINKTKVFMTLKLINNIKNNNLVKAELLFLQIKSSLKNVINIFIKKRHQVLTKNYNIFKMKLNISNASKNRQSNLKQKLEKKYRDEMENFISKNSKSINDLNKDIKDIEKNIKMLQKKDSDLKSEISDFSEKEKKLNDNIKSLENANSTIQKSLEQIKQQSTNISSINNNSKYDSEIHSLENTIESNKQLKDNKEEIIKIFYHKMNNLMNEYETYIDSLFNSENINNINPGNVEFSDNSNQQSLSHKEGSANTCFTSQTLSNRQSNRIQNNNSQGNSNGNVNFIANNNNVNINGNSNTNAN